MSTKHINLIYFFAILAFSFFISSVSKAEASYVKINYGISTHDMGTTTNKGTITHDDEDEGFIFSAGYMLGQQLGIDFMYYDLGSSSLGALDVGDQVKIGGNNYAVTTAGTISNDISGFGIGFIGSTNQDSSFSSYIKAGAHSWDKSGSTTLLDNSNAFAGSFYDQGIGAYGGVGVAYNFDTFSFDIAYDIIGLSKDASFENSSTLISLGLGFKF